MKQIILSLFLLVSIITYSQVPQFERHYPIYQDEWGDLDTAWGQGEYYNYDGVEYLLGTTSNTSIAAPIFLKKGQYWETVGITDTVDMRDMHMVDSVVYGSFLSWSNTLDNNVLSHVQMREDSLVKLIRFDTITLANFGAYTGAVWFNDVNNGAIIIDATRLLITHDGGETWIHKTITDDQGNSTYPNEYEFEILRGKDNFFIASDKEYWNGFHYYVSYDLGDTWEWIVTFDGVSAVNDMFVFDENNFFSCGNSGGIFENGWDDYGPSISQSMNSIYFKNVNEGVSVGEAGNIWYTSNGGTFWQSISWANPSYDFYYVTYDEIASIWVITGFSPGSDVEIILKSESIASISKNEKRKVDLYPNPASTAITIEGASSVVIYDALGRSVFSKSNIIGSEILDISDLPNGVYSADVENNTTKFIIQR
jgi:hypothetical protein